MCAPFPSTIAIDGPAAAGKSTVAQRLAARLGYLYFDTGVMYRAVTLAALEREMDLQDEPTVTRLAQELVIDILPTEEDDGRQTTVVVDGRDVTWALRRREVDAHVSLVSAYAGVRRALTLRQREVGMRGRVVMVGRDIGTVVLPKADLKIYLDATVDVRAMRRYREFAGSGQGASYEEILQGMMGRDEFDSTRAVSPLRPAEDAVRLDTTGLSEDQVFERMMAIVTGSSPKS